MALGYEDVVDSIRQFHAMFPRPGIEDLVGLLSPLEGPLDAGQRGQPWPIADAPGVYFVFDQERRLEYVGKSGADMRVRRHGAGRSGYIAFLALPRDRWFEAAAIESYLVRRLTPPKNRNERTDRREERKRALEFARQNPGAFEQFRQGRSRGV